MGTSHVKRKEQEKRFSEKKNGKRFYEEINSSSTPGTFLALRPPSKTRPRARRTLYLRDGESPLFLGEEVEIPVGNETDQLRPHLSGLRDGDAGVPVLLLNGLDLRHSCGRWQNQGIDYEALLVFLRVSKVYNNVPDGYYYRRTSERDWASNVNPIYYYY